MAGGAAKIGRLHIADAAIGKLAGNHDIKKSGNGDESGQLAKLRIPWIDGLEVRRHLAPLAHPAPAQINSKRNEQEASDKNPRQKKIDNNPHVRMHTATAQCNG